jgi:hypothetical protein
MAASPRRIGISMNMIKHWLLWSTLAGAALTASAQNGGPPADGKPPAPPPEAVAACKGKTEGTKVQFTGRRGETVNGVCKKMGDVLAAWPEGGPGPRPDAK